MKLRIKGNSLRLRLTQAEVQRVAEGKAVQEQVSFGSALPSLWYTLTVEPNAPQITAQYQDHTVRVILPEALAHPWATTEQVSLEATLPLNGEELYILVEKDFQCLHQRPREDEHDQFPNPAAS